MSIKVMNHVWEKAPVRGTMLLMLIAIADNANDHGAAWPGIPKLAEKTRMTERNAQVVLRKLEAAGQLLIDERPGTSNMYRIPFTEELQAEAQRRLNATPQEDEPVGPPNGASAYQPLSHPLDRLQHWHPRWPLPAAGVKVSSGVGGESFFGGNIPQGVNQDSGGGESFFRGGVNPVSPKPPMNRQKEPPEKSLPPPNNTQSNEEVFRFYEDNIGHLTPHMRDELTAAITDHGPDQVIYAMREAVTHNKRTWSYCRAILDRIHRDAEKSQAIAQTIAPPAEESAGAQRAAPDPHPKRIGEGPGVGFKPSPMQISTRLNTPWGGGIGETPTIRNAWEIALNQLKLQLGQANERYLNGITLTDFEPETHTFCFAATTTHIRDMCQHRLYRNIWRVLADVYSPSVVLRFECPAESAQEQEHAA